MPPAINVTPTFRTTRGFTLSAGGSYSCTGSEIACALGSICHNANTAVAAFSSSFRIHSITLWPAPSLSAFGNGTVEWSNPLGNSRDQQIIEITPIGTSVTRRVFSTPPANSLCADWIVASNSNYSSNTVVVLTADAGTVCYVDVECTLGNEFSLVTKGVASGTAGLIYYLALDGPTTNAWQPIGLPTTH
jgi:hypothetical protein